MELTLQRPPRSSIPARPPAPPLPAPRGERSAFVVDVLRGPPRQVAALPPSDVDPLADEDAALALHVLYELHYRGFAGVDDAWEWEPSLLALTRMLEAELVERLVDEVGAPTPVAPEDVLRALDTMASDDGPSLSRWILEHGDQRHVREFAVHRSIYQRKEADPHTFGIPRLVGRAKAALVEIQRGEYGDGKPEQVHAELFADTMRLLGLDDTYGAYLDVVPAPTLTTGNLITLFGLHRRWRGALVGHLAVFEMCSVGPMGRYAAAFRRLGFPDRAARFYDVHVEADAHHEVVARDQMVAGLLEAEPELGGDVLFGARALAAVESRFASHLLDAWRAGVTSLHQVAARRAS